MRKEYDEYKEMSDILKAELDREAREILAEIEADESLKDLTMPDEAEEELMQKIRMLEEKKKAYKLLSDADKEALRIGREIQMQKENDVDGEKVVTFKKRKKRVWLLAAAAAILALGMGMTSVGEVPLVTRISEVMFGEKELTNVDSEREDEKLVENTANEEIAVYEEIKNAFGVNIVRLDYRPSGTKLYRYEIQEYLNKASILYQYENNIIDYQMFFNYNSQSQGYAVDSTLISEKALQVNNIDIILQEYNLMDGDLREYIAEFDYQDVHYILSSLSYVSEAEIEKILKNLKIF